MKYKKVNTIIDVLNSIYQPSYDKNDSDGLGFFN